MTANVTKVSVLLVVCLYENNFGDLLIYNTIRNKLELHGFAIDIVEISDSIDQSDFINKANNNDFIYFVGGGIIEKWAPEIIAKFDQYYSVITKPYGVIGLSCGDFFDNYKTMSTSLRLFSDKASFFFTRDRESVEVFKMCGATKLPISSADVVFANEFCTDYRPLITYNTANFRNIPYTDVTGDIDWNGWSKVLKSIDVDSLINDCSDAHNKLNIPISNRPIVFDIMNSHIIISMRFHIILVAAMLNIPAIPICYCPKVSRLASQLGLEDYALGIHDSHRLNAVYSAMERNYTAVKLMLLKRVAMLHMQSTQAINSSVVKILEMTGE